MALPRSVPAAGPPVPELPPAERHEDDGEQGAVQLGQAQHHRPVQHTVPERRQHERDQGDHHGRTQRAQHGDQRIPPDRRRRALGLLGFHAL